MKIKVKKLKKPIRTTIHIRVRCWWDRQNGISYHSYRVLINSDYGNELIGKFQCGRYDKYDLLKEIQEKYALRVAPYTRYDGRVVKGSIWEDCRIYVSEEVRHVTKAEAKQFGTKP